MGPPPARGVRFRVGRSGVAAPARANEAETGERARVHVTGDRGRTDAPTRRGTTRTDRRP